MRKTVTGRRLFSREFKIAAVRRVLGGEPIGTVAQDLKIAVSLLWEWKKRVLQLGEDHLYDIGARPGRKRVNDSSENQARRIEELERLVGRQQAEISFLETALHRVEERRREKKNAGGAASSK